MSSQRFLLAGVIICSAFAAYISLVPFSFRALSFVEFHLQLRNGLEAGISSPANFLANIVLFVPVGLLGAGAAAGPRLRLASAVPVLVGAAALSVTIECLQVFVPGRTPSAADVGAQLVGTTVGLAVWRVVGSEVLRWFGGHGLAHTRSTISTLLAAYAAARTVTLLLPLDVTVSLSTLAQKYRSGRIRYIPFSHASLSESLVQDSVVSLLGAIPLGALAVIGWPRTRRAVPIAVLAATAFLACIEVAQVIVVSRVADVTDVITGALGATIGALAASSIVGRPEVESALSRGTGWSMSILALIGGAGLFAVYNLTPFDFEFSATVVRERLPLLMQVPFYGYYQNSEFQAVSDFLTKFLLAMPMGIATSFLLANSHNSPYPRLRWMVALTVAAAFFTGVEVAQLLLPNRYPDSTDVFIAGLGFVTGGWLPAVRPSKVK